MCELGFQHLSAPILEGLQKVWSKISSFLVFTISIDGEVGRFHPMVERGDATGAWSFSNIGVLQSNPLCCIVRQI
jgi:hypothetical protein